MRLTGILTVAPVIVARHSPDALLLDDLNLHAKKLSPRTPWQSQRGQLGQVAGRITGKAQHGSWTTPRKQCRNFIASSFKRRSRHLQPAAANPGPEPHVLVGGHGQSSRNTAASLLRIHCYRTSRVRSKGFGPSRRTEGLECSWLGSL